ncbi:MAG: hypothetical protein RL684_2142 [Pseudomonadota bacterium]
MLAATLAAGTDLPVPIRLCPAALSLALMRPGWRWLAGPPACRALRWLPDGRWQVRRGDAAGHWSYVKPVSLRRLGPLLWLEGGSGADRIRLILDAAAMEPNAMRLLQARVRWSIPTRGAGRQKVSE